MFVSGVLAVDVENGSGIVGDGDECMESLVMYGDGDVLIKEIAHRDVNCCGNKLPLNVRRASPYLKDKRRRKWLKGLTELLQRYKGRQGA